MNARNSTLIAIDTARIGDTEKKKEFRRKGVKRNERDVNIIEKFYRSYDSNRDLYILIIPRQDPIGDQGDTNRALKITSQCQYNYVVGKEVFVSRNKDCVPRIKGLKKVPSLSYSR